jgi:hypothetical protein
VAAQEHEVEEAEPFILAITVSSIANIFLERIMKSTVTKVIIANTTHAVV